MISSARKSLNRHNDLYRQGFTLVELLVVIAIVSVLLALVIPSFQRAREVANVASCASNFRQLCIAMYAYTQDDREGALPWTSRFSSGWGIRMTPYLGAPYEAGLTNPEDNSYFGPLFKKYSVFRCPQNQRITGSNYYNWNYGYNARLSAGVTSGNAGQQLIAWKDRRTLPQIKYNPAKILMMSDCQANNILGFGDLNATLNYSGGPRVHLEKKLNLAFLDGHVKLLEQDEDNTLIHVDGVSQASPTGAPTGW